MPKETARNWRTPKTYAKKLELIYGHTNLP